MIPGKSFGRWEVLAGGVVLYVVKVGSIVITRQVVDNGRHGVADGIEVPLTVLEKCVVFNLFGALVAQTR